MADTIKARAWLYGLTADEWLHLAAEGQDSEVGPCCGDIGALREWLQALATCQGTGDSWLCARSALDAYLTALSGHETLGSPEIFPLLHRVLAGIRSELADRGCSELLPKSNVGDAEKILRELEAASPRPPVALSESQRFQVSEARDILATWDLVNPGGISRETVLADQVRALLAIIDQAFPVHGQVT